MTRRDRDLCCVLNAGPGAWAFEPLARRLSGALAIDVSDTPRAFNYVLGLGDEEVASFDPAATFIPFNAIHLASDKRLLAGAFAAAGVPTPRTCLTETAEDAWAVVCSDKSGAEWCLKFPTGCGAAGHRLINGSDSFPHDWPRPYVVQEFIRLERPQVHRLYVAGVSLFGWNVRSFPEGTKPSPWVAHARGARYASAGDPPPDALHAARAALAAAGLIDSFGCADLLRAPDGRWLVLEVGTDGLFNHVDRDLGLPDAGREIDTRVRRAFWSWVSLNTGGSAESSSTSAR